MNCEEELDKVKKELIALEKDYRILIDTVAINFTKILERLEKLERKNGTNSDK